METTRGFNVRYAGIILYLSGHFKKLYIFLKYTLYGGKMEIIKMCGMYYLTQGVETLFKANTKKTMKKFIVQYPNFTDDEKERLLNILEYEA